MSVIITGSNGFLGRALVDKLKDVYKLIGITKDDDSKNSLLEQYTPEKLLDLKFEPEIIVMCHAAVASGNNHLNASTLFESNVKFTSELVKKFPESYLLYISTIAVYGNQETCFNEETLTCPTTEYAISKLWGEKVVSKAKNFGILRLSSLYGNFMKENTIIPNYVNQSLQKGVIEVWGKGQRKQNYFHVNDAVGYIKKIIAQKKKGVFLGASSKEISNLELANIIAKQIGADISLIKEDISLSISIDNNKTREILTVLEEKDFLEGIKDYINWKQKQF